MSTPEVLTMSDPRTEDEAAPLDDRTAWTSPRLVRLPAEETKYYGGPVGDGDAGPSGGGIPGG